MASLTIGKYTLDNLKVVKHSSEDIRLQFQVRGESGTHEYGLPQGLTAIAQPEFGASLPAAGQRLDLFPLVNLGEHAHAAIRSSEAALGLAGMLVLMLRDSAEHVVAAP